MKYTFFVGLLLAAATTGAQADFVWGTLFAKDPEGK